MFPVFPIWFVLLVFGLPASVLGVVASGVACLILRRHWSVRAAAIDAVLAFVVWFVSGCTIVDVEMALGALQRGAGIGKWLDYTISTVSVVVRHLIPRYFTVRISKIHRSTT